MEEAGRRVRAVLKRASRGDRRSRSELLRLWGLADLMGLESVSLKDKGQRPVRRPAPEDPDEGELR